MSLTDLYHVLKGGTGSGNWGHAGVPEKRGGSAPRSFGMSLRTGRNWKARQIEKKGLRGQVPGDLPQLKVYNHITQDDPPTYFEDEVPMWFSDVRGKVKDNLVLNISNGTGIPYNSVNRVIRQWADSSNDMDYASLSIQEAASELFNSPLSDWQKEQIPKSLSGYMNKHVLEDVEHGPYDSPKSATKALLSEMYDQTQNEFKKAGITSIKLYRGTRNPFPPGVVSGDTVQVKGNTLESWSFQKPVSRNFGHNIVSMEVPIERILSSARTGFGCLNEWEFVIIGGKNDEAKIESPH